MQAQEQNLHPAAGYEPRITQKHLLQSFAQKALANVPGAKAVIDKHFNTSLLRPELKPAKPIDLVMHLGHDHSTR